MKNIYSFLMMSALFLLTKPGQASVGDSCGNAIPISVIPGNYPFNTTTGYSNNYSSNCGGNGYDIVFQVEIPADSSVGFWITNDDFDVVLSIHKDSCDGVEFWCKDDPDSDTVYFENTSSSVMSIWIIVDAYYTADGGVGTLNYDFFPNQPGNICYDPIVLAGTTGSYDFDTDTVGYLNYNIISDCSYGEGNDLFLVLQDSLEPGFGINIWTSNDNYDVVIALGLGDPCLATNSEICHDDADGDTLTFENYGLTTEQIWVIIDGYDLGGGTGTFNWNFYSLTPIPAGGICGTAISLVGTSGSYDYNTADSLGYIDSHTFNDCNGNGNDLFFVLQNDLQPGYSIDIWTSNDDYDVVLSFGLGDPCLTNTSELCHDDTDGDTLQYSNTGLTTEQMWVVVDGFYLGGGSATFNWNIYQTPFYEGSTCDSTVLLAGMSGSYDVNSEPSAFSNSSVNSDCNASGNDFYITLDEVLQPGYSINIWNTNDDYDVVMYMGTGDICVDSPSLLCNDDPDSEVLRYDNTGGSAINLWVVVDGFNTGGGTATFNWEIFMSPVAGPGSACDTPIVLSNAMGSYDYNTDDSLGFYDTIDSSFYCYGQGNNIFFLFEDSLSAGDTLFLWTTDDNYDVVLSTGFGSCLTGDSISVEICHDDTDGDTLALINNTSTSQIVWAVVDGYYGNGTATLNWMFNDDSLITQTHLNKALASIRVWPNPSNGKINIDLSSLSVEKGIMVEVRDITSRVVYQNNAQKSVSEIDLSDLSAGFYSLSVYQSGVIYAQKSIIVKK